MDQDLSTNADLVKIAADVVAAYVANNSISSADLPRLIAEVHAALARIEKAEISQEVEVAKPVPAVPIKKSVTPDFLISLEDGKKYKSLKRHLSSSHGMTPEDYRAKWGLPADYPMVAPNYARQRSELAKTMGLGQGRRSIPRGK
ncbi:MucR family transcriptional regulator [Labrys miyagiensis]|uniref:MucR family transcriptional regulator n=1 Tax=Labrys miyagiensis TaxID=346912 RepID=A0ABQ6CNS4_9HYPH|nr:MucR family transcriptional regulator [Labrys miyagiensis]GLS21465.1 MucR family transcriptional regulator [Labrys miyagiensis]